MSNDMALIPKVPAGPVPASATAAIQKEKGASRAERRTILLSDNNMIMKQVLEMHSLDTYEVNVKPLLVEIEYIFSLATHSTDAGVTEDLAKHVENMKEKTDEADFITKSTIDLIAGKLEHKALSKAMSRAVSGAMIGEDAHRTAMSILKKRLNKFTWDAKLVLTLTAFALKYGNPLAKLMATQKQLPAIKKQLTPMIPALKDLISTMLMVTQCLVQLYELGKLASKYISADVQAFSDATAVTPAAVYWTIKSAVACSANITALAREHTTFTMDEWEISGTANRLKNISEHLQKQIALCRQHIDEKMHMETYQNLLNLLETVHTDNMKILTALICPWDDSQPLIDGSTKGRVNIDVLRRRNVLLLISSLEISSDELTSLEQIHNESKQHAMKQEHLPDEIVWIPVFDRSTSTTQWTDEMEKRFKDIQETMLWYSVYHPNLIDQGVIRFIKEVWHFRNKPILVVLDPQGKVVSPNAIHMMWIWGSNALPFTTRREEDLWREETWRLELLVGDIDPTILNWIQKGQYIFLYGGDDLEWIRKFTSKARQVAAGANIPLEMVYVGKSTKREKVRRTIAAITAEKLSYCLEDLAEVWWFWTRLESMLFSKIQLGKADDHDNVMQEIKKLLSHDKTGGWAVLARGSRVVVNGHGTTVLPTLEEYDLWKQQVPVVGYDLAFKEHHDKLHGIELPCCRLELPTTAGRIPDQMKCPECQRIMENLAAFLCCHDDAHHGTIANIYD